MKSVALSKACCKAGDKVIPFHAIAYMDTRQIEQLRVRLHLLDGSCVDAVGLDAVELVMQLKPSAFEGRRLSWARRAWWVHNFIGHPVMQILALMGQPAWGIWVHDRTVPMPRGTKLGS